VEIEHMHCPCACDHPQPFHLADDDRVPPELRGKWICGACYHDDRSLCVMLPCTPEICGE
jgi:hypothetical protein